MNGDGKDDRGLVVTPEGVAFSDEALVQAAFEQPDQVAYFGLLTLAARKSIDPERGEPFPPELPMGERVRRTVQPLRASLYRTLDEMAAAGEGGSNLTIHVVIARMLESFQNPKVQETLDRAGALQGRTIRPITSGERLRAITFLKAIRYLETERLAADAAALHRSDAPVASVAVEHDYTRDTLRWGHNYCTPLIVKNGTALGWGPIGGPRMKAGDVLLVTGSKNSELRFRIVAVTYKADPPDMWEATLSEMS